MPLLMIPASQMFIHTCSQSIVHISMTQSRLISTPHRYIHILLFLWTWSFTSAYNRGVSLTCVSVGVVHFIHS